MTDARTCSAAADGADVAAPTRTSRAGALLAHVLCLLTLMWAPLVNGQAFYFYDSTNYIRSADMALYLASGKRVTTVWTTRYAGQLPGVRKQAGAPAATPSPTHNDLSAGLVMAGRSPYIGAIMYLSYLLSDFWLFILFQAATAYALILLALRRFGVTRLAATTAITLTIALTTSISYYNGLLLADAFAAFGVAAFLLMATPGRLSRIEQAFLVGVIALSVASHMTHIVILTTMLGAALVLACLGWMDKVPRRGWIVGLGGVVFGLASVHLTALATEAALGKRPQLLPLFTARFLADGPGQAFIASGCDGNRFQICRVRRGNVDDANLILSGRGSGIGTYLEASSDERRRMGEEDTAFALAVFRFAPVEQTRSIVANTLRQLTWVEYDGLNMGCFERPYCWDNLPPAVREQFRHSLSGRRAWPKPALDLVQDAAVLASVAMLAIWIICSRGSPFDKLRMLRAWIIITLLAMIVNAAFGGAVVEPQYRYNTRLVWLITLYAAIAVSLRGGHGKPGAAPHSDGR